MIRTGHVLEQNNHLEIFILMTYSLGIKTISTYRSVPSKHPSPCKHPPPIIDDPMVSAYVYVYKCLLHNYKHSLPFLAREFQAPMGAY